MASSTSDDNDIDIVILECSDDSAPIAPETSAPTEISISTADIFCWDLSAILSHRIVRVQANRRRLTEQSSYFHGLLGGSFSESQLHSVSVQWSLEAFLNTLRFMYGCRSEVSSCNLLSLFPTALYFGVDSLLSQCRTWLSDISNQLELDPLVHIYNFALQNEIDWIPGLCISYIARNFMSAMANDSFVNIPYSLLHSCVEHPQLTIDSERHLSEALLTWVFANIRHAEHMSDHECDWIDILKQVRFCLLPLWFAMGERKCCRFSELVDHSIDAILTLSSRRSSMDFLDIAGDGNLTHLRIRLTEYTKKLDLSGCSQIDPAILVLSLLPRPYSVDLTLRERAIRPTFTHHPCLTLDSLNISPALSLALTFETVQEIDISRCPNLHLGPTFECFSKSFPSLQILKAAYRRDKEALKILLRMCPSVCEVDLTVDASPIIPSQVSVTHSSWSPKRAQEPLRYWDENSVCFSKITKLVLEGRTDICDSDLHNIAKFCVSLSYLNIKRCYSVTDAGISHLLGKCARLHSLIACDTALGKSSILSLCSNIGKFHMPHSTEKKIESSNVTLQMLHIAGCRGIDEASLGKILCRACMLKSLCLRDTLLVDDAVYNFKGSSLEVLNVSNTMVTGAALSHIIHQNPGLRCLKARGCKELHQHRSTNDDMGSLSSLLGQELYFELRKTCKLEEFTIGWGFSLFSLDALGPAVVSLKAITVGLGGSLGPEGLMQLPSLCPLLESITLLFQIISDDSIKKLMETLRNLQALELCHCMGDISALSLNISMPKLRRLKLERVTPWMTNDDLALLTQNCANLTELSLIGCVHLDEDAQRIISCGWPGLISLHLEECGEVTANGVGAFFDCLALEDLLLRHTLLKHGLLILRGRGLKQSDLVIAHSAMISDLVIAHSALIGSHHLGRGLPLDFITDAASRLPMLRKISVDCCDAIEDGFRQPFLFHSPSLRIVKIARCDKQNHGLELQNIAARRRRVHKDTFVILFDGDSSHTRLVNERIS